MTQNTLIIVILSIFLIAAIWKMYDYKIESSHWEKKYGHADDDSKFWKRYSDKLSQEIVRLQKVLYQKNKRANSTEFKPASGTPKKLSAKVVKK